MYIGFRRRGLHDGVDLLLEEGVVIQDRRAGFNVYPILCIIVTQECVHSQFLRGCWRMVVSRILFPGFG
jgi:hypothetical protein